MRTPKGGIAFFDSGIGGLTVLRSCRKLLPNEIFYYYGDNKHAPYGNLPPKKITKYVLKAFKRFQKLHVQAAVVACNTATAVCVEALRRKFSFPIIGAEPAVFAAAKRGGEVFVLTTRATYESARFYTLCKKAERLFPNADLKLYPCDDLAGEIERHIFERDRDYTKSLPIGKPVTVVLGCTHYVYIAEQIKDFYQCEVCDGNEGIAKRLCTVLQEVASIEKTPQPLDDPFCPHNNQKYSFKPSLTADISDKSRVGKGEETNKNTNKRLHIKMQKMGKKGRKGAQKRIFFLGNRKKYNKKVCEQMFAYDTSG